MSKWVEQFNGLNPGLSLFTTQGDIMYAILLGLVLGSMTETNFRRALLISNGSPAIFFSSIYCVIFLILIAVAVGTIVRGKIKARRAKKED